MDKFVRKIMMKGERSGTYRTSSMDQHFLHTNVYCNRTSFHFQHSINCAGCGVKLAEGKTKICTRAHQYCPTETSLCK